MNGRTRMRKISLACVHTLVGASGGLTNVCRCHTDTPRVLPGFHSQGSGPRRRRSNRHGRVFLLGGRLGGTREELAPFEALSLQFGDMNGVAYYTVQGPSYRVVATLATEAGIPVRFEGSLLPGQKLVVSIPDSARAKAQ